MTQLTLRSRHLSAEPAGLAFMAALAALAIVGAFLIFGRGLAMAVFAVVIVLAIRTVALAQLAYRGRCRAAEESAPEELPAVEPELRPAPPRVWVWDSASPPDFLRQLYVNCVAARAWIVEVDAPETVGASTGGHGGGAPAATSVHFEYAYRFAGQIHVGSGRLATTRESSPAPSTELERWCAGLTQRGATFTVLIDPRSPRDHRAYGVFSPRIGGAFAAT